MLVRYIITHIDYIRAKVNPLKKIEIDATMVKYIGL